MATISVIVRINYRTRIVLRGATIYLASRVQITFIRF